MRYRLATFDDSGHDVVIDKGVFENVRETERAKISVIEILLRLKTYGIRNQFMEKGSCIFENS